ISDNFDGCEIVWATREGRFLEGTARRSAACNHTQVLSSGHPSSHRPVRASPGQVILWSMDSDGRVDELSLAPDSAEAVSLALSEPGPRFFHSLMALEHEGRTGALWVRTEDDARREVHFGLVSREGERLVPSMTQITQADDSPYVVRMSIAWCAGRFVAAHESESQLWVQQMDANGRPIGEPLALDDSVPSGGRRTIACFEGGALVTTWSEAHVLGCE
ncbi:MAG: hypothetical protein IT378_07680, partial [Sandaracinaceae bacterium]|nr:hypothetical protein [Sandaracinaceae bacterium]